MRRAIVDTGPVVAFLDRSEGLHAWVSEQMRQVEPPLLVCEAVLAEAMFLLAGMPEAQDALLGLLEKGALRIGLHLGEHAGTVRALCRKYRDIPMSLADACIVRMAELFDGHSVFTLDSDFSVYRKHKRGPLTLIIPS
jgi:uncharacterized protein